MFEEKQYFVIDMHCHVGDPEVPKRMQKKERTIQR